MEAVGRGVVDVEEGLGTAGREGGRGRVRFGRSRERGGRKGSETGKLGGEMEWDRDEMIRWS